MKYMGSKSRISKEISMILNTEIRANGIIKYLEPFVGGANMIEKIICENRYGLDNNSYLIAMWKALQTGWIPPHSLSKQEYDSIKSNAKAYPKELVAIAGFCATYNAKWFGGYAGIVTTKINTKRNYYDEAIRNILKQIPKLQTVTFKCLDYKRITVENTKGFLIYCDPPYANSTQYKDEFDHKSFWEWVRSLSRHNILYVSEYNAPNDFDCIWEKQLTTTLDKNSRKLDTEKLFKLRN